MIFCTPEYNFSIPGGLKNALDWVSRLQNQPFAGKPVALQSASPGPVGGARVQYDLRKAMVFLDAFMLNKPEIFIGSCAAKFDEKTGELKDETTRGFIKQQLAASFATFIARVAPKVMLISLGGHCRGPAIRYQCLLLRPSAHCCRLRDAFVADPHSMCW